MRIVAIIAVLAAGLIGLFMSLCGGFFLGAALWTSITSDNHDAMLFIVPAGLSLALGLGVLWPCIRYIRRHRTK